jgi:hypothetical protein
VDHGENINLVGLEAIDNAVCPFDDLTDLVRLELGHLPPGKREIRYLLGTSSDPVNHSPGILN